MRFIGIMLFTVSVNTFATEDFDRQQIEQRIKPVGQIRLQQQKTTPSAAPAEEQTKKEDAPGQAIYEQYCAICHKDGVAGAPKFRAADWKPRFETKKLEGLTASALKGLNVMPPKGTCMDCSEEQIKDAIQYMLPKS